MMKLTERETDRLLTGLRMLQMEIMQDSFSDPQFREIATQDGKFALPTFAELEKLGWRLMNLGDE
jgi:hypothetical protein